VQVLCRILLTLVWLCCCAMLLAHRSIGDRRYCTTHL